MPLIKARTNRVRTVRHICRLQEPSRNTLLQYARFIGDSADYVLNQLLDGTLGKDKDFLSWRTEQGITADTPPPQSGGGRRRRVAEQTV
jgi:hypothetical protein